MKIVVAMDSLKGSLDARSACEAAARGVRAACPEAGIVLKPMADGGEGTAEAFRAAWGGTWIRLRVMGPLPGHEVDAAYAWFEERGCSVVEMAAASGITLLAQDELDPLRTTTFGTGQLLGDAFRHGAPVLLAVGGSATVDGGVGAATALGWKFLDAAGQPVPPGGGALRGIASIEPPDGRRFPPVEVLVDTTAPLCGPEGAAPTFAPQKGATPAMVETLARGLEHLAAVIRRDVGVDIASLPGGGAGGGLAAGAVAFLGARLVPGARAVIEATGLQDALSGADWVITGEGCFDATSLRGKVVSGVIEAARHHGTRVAILAGSVKLAEPEWRAAGVEAAAALRPENMPLERAMTHARVLLEERAAGLARTMDC